MRQHSILDWRADSIVNVELIELMCDILIVESDAGFGFR
jgi:hypothetical protein